MADNKIKMGIDLTEIKRIEKSIEKNADFLMRFFGDEERQLFRGKNASARVAAAFAAKEAFSKALGTGVKGFSLREVQALRDENGAPFLKLSGKAAELVEKSGLSLSISLTHTSDYAAAVVVAYEQST